MFDGVIIIIESFPHTVHILWENNKNTLSIMKAPQTCEVAKLHISILHLINVV